MERQRLGRFCLALCAAEIQCGRFGRFFSLLFDYSLFLVVIEVVVEVAVVVVFIIIEIVITPTTILYIYVLTLTAVGQGKCKARFEAFYSPLVTSDSTFIFSLLW